MKKTDVLAALEVVTNTIRLSGKPLRFKYKSSFSIVDIFVGKWGMNAAVFEYLTAESP